MTCLKCQHGAAKRFGYFGKHRIQRWRCTSCKATFCEPHKHLTRATLLSRPDAAARAIQCLLEGCSIRSTERLTGLNRNTIMRLLVVAGDRAARVTDSLLRDLRPRYLQCDEIWTYIGKKQRRLRKGESDELGDQWVFVGMDPETKLVVSFQVGKRTARTTYALAEDLYRRMAYAHRTQVTTDGFTFYKDAIPDSFGTDADFAQLIKLFGDYGQFDSPDARYSPPRIVEVISKIRTGNPDSDHICTSHVERQNLTIRMALRRFTRLTNAFSKKLAHLKAAVALHFAYYNFCRVHASLRVTPAMEAGITDRIWSIEELLQNGQR